MGIEIEKKFLLKYHPCRDTGKPEPIIQGYIQKEKHAVVRVRATDTNGFLTIKGPKKNSAGFEFEYVIPRQDALALIRDFCQNRVIEKNRYHMVHNGKTWIIDEFLNDNAGLLVAEIELDSPEQVFDKPDWIGQEVTDDPRYYNSNLTDHPYSGW